MTFSLRIEPESGIAIATCSGVLCIADAKQGAEAVWGTPEWSGRSVVCDLRSAQLDLAAAEIRDTARFILEHQPETPPSRVAVVTSRDLEFGLARMFEVFREDRVNEVEIFRDYGEALAWARSAVARPA